MPKEYIKPIDQGIQEALEGGILAGYPMVDVKATLYDGSYHDVDSNEMAFKIAGSMAFKEAARKASPVLLEPVMAVEVVTPEDYAGMIMGDLSSRRGRIEGMEHRAGSQVIKAIVPLAEMFGYATHMRSSTQGRAEYSMHFARYEEAPRVGGGRNHRQDAGQDHNEVILRAAVSPSIARIWAVDGSAVKFGSGFCAGRIWSELSAGRRVRRDLDVVRVFSGTLIPGFLIDGGHIVSSRCFAERIGRK